jgi:hypothetical protein
VLRVESRNYPGIYLEITAEKHENPQNYRCSDQTGNFPNANIECYHYSNSLGMLIVCKRGKNMGKGITVTGSGGLCGCETLRLPHFLDNRLTETVRILALRAGRPLLSGIFLVLISVRG